MPSAFWQFGTIPLEILAAIGAVLLAGVIIVRITS